MDEEKKLKNLTTANKEIEILKQEKENRSNELNVAYKEIAFQIEERGKRASELAIANIELIFQNEEKEKRAKELTNAILELQKAEAKVRKFNLELEQKVLKRTTQFAFISQINQAIAQALDAETVFRKSCSIALDYGKFKIAWIGGFETSLNKIKLLEYSGVTSEDLKQLTTSPKKSENPQEIVFKSGKYYLCNNIENTPRNKSWNLFVLKHKIRSYIVLPIKKSGRIFGTFNLYSSEVNFFDDEDIKLAEEIASDISFSLNLFEKAEKHKEAEEKILKNEKRFRALIENSNDMITLSSKEGKLLYGSPSIEKLFGYSVDEILNSNSIDYIHPDDLVLFAKNRKKLLKSPGKSFENQIRLKHKNGKWIWCEATLTNMLKESGIEAMVSNFRDISEKKSIEKQQEFDNNNLNALINNTKDLMWSIDRNFNLITSNVPFDEVCKVNFGKAIAKGENVLSVSYTPEIFNYFKQLYERAFAGESFTEIERFDFPTVVWTQISYYPIRKGDEIIGTACHSRDITEIKKIENQLYKSEVFNRGVFNSLSSHIAVIDATGKIVAVNESWRRFAKENGDTYLQHTAEGANYFGVCNKAVDSGDNIAQEVLLGMKAILDEKDNYFYIEYPCHAPNKQRWFGMRAMKFNSDKPMIVVAHVDITERKFVEENLAKSEARLKEAQAIAHISNWELDLNTNVSTWSDEFYNILGVSRKDINPSPDVFLSMLHPDDFEFAKAKVEKTFQTFESDSFSSRIVMKNGKIRHVYSEWKFGLDSSSKPIRVYGILQDITERKIAEEELQKSIKELSAYKLAIDESAIVASTNQKGIIEHVNENFCKISKFSAAELIGKDHRIISSAYHSKEFIRNLWETITMGKIWRGEIRNKAKDSTIYWVDTTIVPFLNENGKPYQYLSIRSDITVRKKGEEEREKLTNDLLQRNRDLEQFTFIISHNLRAPTANIIGFTENLLDETLPNEVHKELLKGLSSSVSGLDNIIKDINSILQVKREINDKKEVIVFSRLVTEIKNSIGNTIEKHNVHIKCDFSETDKILSLKVYLHSIFYNLISNSIKYRKPNEQQIIEIKSKLENGNIILTFKDNGLGIDLKTKGDKVFGLYKRFHSHVEGKGMGLFMVKTQVEAVGGKITIESEPNVGTVFTIVFEN